MTYFFVCFYCFQKKIQMTVIYPGQKNDVWQHFFCKVTTISQFKSGKLHMHWSLKYMHDYILLSSTKTHAQTVYFPSKSYGKILCRKINCSSSFYLVHPTAIAMAGFYKKKQWLQEGNKKKSCFCLCHMEWHTKLENKHKTSTTDAKASGTIKRVMEFA